MKLDALSHAIKHGCRCRVDSLSGVVHHRCSAHTPASRRCCAPYQIQTPAQGHLHSCLTSMVFSSVARTCCQQHARQCSRCGWILITYSYAVCRLQDVQPCNAAFTGCLMPAHCLQLTHSNGQAWKFPVCFMTNGGGVTEAYKAQQLSEWLGVQVHADQVS